MEEKRGEVIKEEDHQMEIIYGYNNTWIKPQNVTIATKRDIIKFFKILRRD